MMIDIKTITNRIQNQGIRSFIQSLPRHILSTVRKPHKLVKIPQISRKELKNRSPKTGDYLEYGRQGNIQISPPRNEDYPEELDAVVGSRECEPGFVGRIRDVLVVGPYALVFAGGRVLLEPVLDGERLDINIQLSGPWRVLILSLVSRVINLIPSRATERVPLAAHCLSHHANNYGVWFASDLMKIRAVEQYAERTGTNPTLLVNENLSPWMRETLDMLGYGPEHRIEIGRKHIRVDELVVPKTRRWVSKHPEIYPSDKRWLRDRFRSRVDIEPDDGMPARIVISRQGTDRRRFENHEAVGDCLEPYSFEFVRPEERSIPEQIQLFANADVIVGSFGSAMTNIMWASDATVVEIFPDGYTGHDFFLLARECGHEHYGIAGKPVPDDPEVLQKHRDIFVDTDELESIISDVVKS